MSRRPVAAITHEARPVSLNDYRNRHWASIAEGTAEWRHAGFYLAKEAKVPHLERISLVVTPFGPGREQDPGNCYPSVKAFVDGMVDAGVVDDDDGKHVAFITLQAWEHSTGTPGLRVVIYDEG